MNTDMIGKNADTVGAIRDNQFLIGKIQTIPNFSKTCSTKQFTNAEQHA